MISDDKMSSAESTVSNRSQNKGPRKDWATRRLARWPLLRLMAQSRPFLLVVVTGICVVVAAPLLLLKIWRVTPPDFSPRVRVSLLDRIQAWSLTRSARAAESRGDFETANQAWRAAAANVPVDYEALRGGLLVIPRLPKPTDFASTALAMGSWMIRLGHTNATDLELIASVWNRCQLFDRTAAISTAVPDVHSANLDRLLAIALFQSGRYAAFQKLLSADTELASAVNQATTPVATGAARKDSDVDFHAISLAYLAIWGPSGQRDTALKQLQEMGQDPKTETLAYEMEMTVFLQHKDLPGMRQAFEHLQANGRVGIWHMTAYWTLLALEGDKEEAVKLAKAANPVPKTDNDVMRLVNTFTLLGLYDEAEQLCRRYFSDPPWVQEGALMRSDLLMRMKRWDDLRLLAYQIRRYPDVESALGGFSLFIEGMAEWAQGYADNAERAFQKAVDVGFPDSRLAIQVAKSLLDIKEAKYAEPVLMAHWKQLDNEPVFLSLLVQCAYYLHVSEFVKAEPAQSGTVNDPQKTALTLMDVVTRLYQLSPKDPVAVNNYAATLLLYRKRPEEAVSLTLQLLQAFPKSPEVALNHASALTMNNRLDDAEKLLDRLQAERQTENLDAATLAQYHLTMFELRLKQGRIEDARTELRAIDTSQLYPVQVAWLEETSPQLDAAPAPKPGS